MALNTVPHEEAMSSLERAIAIAAKAHEGQTDKAGAPYVLHPLRVMLRVTTTEERIVAVLHDVLEDSPITLDDLRRDGFSDVVLNALQSVTKKSEETYEEFVLRAAADPIGRRVKLADLEDNSDLSRIPDPGPRDHARVAKYQRAISTLLSQTGELQGG
jgi:(p)ppGpp synthase/HD superfamily hydrolase